MATDDSDLEKAFDKVLSEQDMLLTPRQRAWQSFKAGAEWAMKQIQKEAIKKIVDPNEEPPK